MLFSRPQKAPPRIAQVLVVKNEERFLREHLAYHLKIGVSRFYLFLDECTDSSQAIAESFPEVAIEEVPQWVRDKGLYLGDRQCWCHDRALHHARKDGYDWLLGLDPDEFAFADNTPESFMEVMGQELARTTPILLQQAHLVPLLTRIPSKWNMISLKTQECFPVLHPEDTRFWEHIYFQGPIPYVHTIVNPVSGEERLWTGLLGHDNGKALVRTTANIQAKNPHLWTINQNAQLPKRPRNKPYPFFTAGKHFHYTIVSPKHWHEKYSKHQTFPDTWNGGRSIEFPKLSWTEATRRLPEDEALNYARKQVFISSDEAEVLANKDMLIRDAALRDIFMHSLPSP